MFIEKVEDLDNLLVEERPSLNNKERYVETQEEWEVTKRIGILGVLSQFHEDDAECYEKDLVKGVVRWAQVHKLDILTYDKWKQMYDEHHATDP